VAAVLAENLQYLWDGADRTNVAIITNRKLHTIGAEINDLGWPWMATTHRVSDCMGYSEPTTKIWSFFSFLAVFCRKWIRMADKTVIYDGTCKISAITDEFVERRVREAIQLRLRHWRWLFIASRPPCRRATYPHAVTCTSSYNVPHDPTDITRHMFTTRASPRPPTTKQFRHTALITWSPTAGVKDLFAILFAVRPLQQASPGRSRAQPRSGHRW